MNKKLAVVLVIVCLAALGWAVWAQESSTTEQKEEEVLPPDEIVEELGQLEEELIKATEEDGIADKTDVAEKVTKVSKDLNAVKSKLEVNQKVAAKEQTLNETIFKYGLPIIIAFILILTALGMAPRMLAILMKRDDLGDHDNESEMLYTITVFLVIISILVLGSRGIVKGDSLSTILAAIVSFVLGSMSKEKAKKRKKPDEE